MSEFALIDVLRDHLAGIGARRLVLGIGDDAALWRPSEGCDVVACCDTLIEGRHFPAESDPGDIGWKALAVNLSDLAAMGARPIAALLALSLPALPARGWLDAFCDGWKALAAMHEVALAGGDTTRGPVLALTVTCFGEVPQGTALLRSGARPGDGIYVSGSLGDAAAGLALWPVREEAATKPLIKRLARPLPRLALGEALRGRATSAIDISDGLLADLGHVLAASSVGATIESARLPLSRVLLAAIGEAQARDLALTGGDDYELCFTVPAECEDELAVIAAATATPLTRIGRITAAAGVRLIGSNGEPLSIPRSGWDHFP
jgi:thiamine-monophosphate kinase